MPEFSHRPAVLLEVHCVNRLTPSNLVDPMQLRITMVHSSSSWLEGIVFFCDPDRGEVLETWHRKYVVVVPGGHEES